MSRRGIGSRLLALALVSLAPAACGKRGDPLPPLRRDPRPVSGFGISQLGTSLEVRYTAPSASVDGVPFEALQIELLRAEGEGPFEDLARRERHEAVPGESERLTLALPPPGTLLRFAARARSGRHGSSLTDVVSLEVRDPPPPPAAFTASQLPGGIVLAWHRPEILTRPAPEPEPPVNEAPAEGPGQEPSSAARPPVPPPAPSAAATGPATEAPAPPEAGAPPPTEGPEPPAEPASPAAGKPSAGVAPAAKATPTPPQRGVYVYRRTEPGEYVAPLTADPLQTEGYVDTDAAPGDRYCYVARSVVARDPLVASEATPEVCFTLRDLEPPPAPIGVTVVTLDEGLEVSWSPLPPGVAGVRVLRRDDGGAPRLLAELPPEATRWVDPDAPRGPRLVYLLVAVDAAGNQSTPAPAPPVTRR